MLGQVAVPDLERVHVRAGSTLPDRGTGRLEQGIALFEHPVVVRPDSSEPGRSGDQELVQEAPALTRVALDQRRGPPGRT